MFKFSHDHGKPKHGEIQTFVILIQTALSFM